MLYITAEEALGLGRAIVPAWVEHRGCVVRQAGFAAANFDDWWRTTNGERRLIELVLNHLHLWDLLVRTDEKDYRELWDLGELMVVGWRASLTEAFPDRQFDVTLDDDYGPTITAATAEAHATSPRPTHRRRIRRLPPRTTRSGAGKASRRYRNARVAVAGGAFGCNTGTVSKREFGARVESGLWIA